VLGGGGGGLFMLCSSEEIRPAQGLPALAHASGSDLTKAAPADLVHERVLVLDDGDDAQHPDLQERHEEQRVRFCELWVALGENVEAVRVKGLWWLPTSGWLFGQRSGTCETDENLLRDCRWIVVGSAILLPDAPAQQQRAASSSNIKFELACHEAKGTCAVV